MMMRTILVLAGLLCLLAPRAFGQLTGADWCQSPNVTKSSAVINCSGTGECLLGGAVPNQQIQLCTAVFEFGGTTAIAQFDSGTQTSTVCDTDVKHLTGAMKAGAMKTLRVINEGPDLMTAASNQLCMNLGGTTPTAAGVITFVQIIRGDHADYAAAQ
jgi:hypothetical protein